LLTVVLVRGVRWAGSGFHVSETCRRVWSLYTGGMLCSKCKLPKPENELVWKKDGKRHGYCLECKRAYAKEHYKRNAAVYKARAKQWTKAHRKWLQDLKTATCADCKLPHPYWRMHFDHLRDKRGEISLLMRSVGKSTILEEIAKCDLVCANCHADRTHARMHEKRKAASALPVV
jgi:hypothetical protein